MKRTFSIMCAWLATTVALWSDTQAIDEAIDLADADNAEAAAEALSGELTTPRGSLPWFQQAADRLILKAFERREKGDFERSIKAAQASTKMLKKALKKLEADSRSEDRSHLYWQMAIIQIEFFKDEGEGMRLLKKSIKECPQNASALDDLRKLAPLLGERE